MTTNLDARLAGYSSPFLSIFRIIFGLLFTLHGTQKLFDWPVAAPMPVEVGAWPAWWAGLIEFVLGILITLGLFTRIAAFVASGEMAVAYFWMHWPPLEGRAGIVLADRQRRRGGPPVLLRLPASGRDGRGRVVGGFPAASRAWAV